MLMTTLHPSPGGPARPPIEIVIYRSGECGAWRDALATSRQSVRELRLDASIRVVKVRDLDEARRLRFHGSPSVEVNGVDVEGPEVGQQPASFG
jgi:hypothetical protein